jgi:uncharacterized membrane protein YeaQ/YmgE (transglycosylase-associated protein family)
MGRVLRRKGNVMAEGSGFGKLVLYVVLGVVGLIVAGWVLGAVIGALWNILVATLIIAAIVGVALLVLGATRRSVGGRNNRQLPR